MTHPATVPPPRATDWAGMALVAAVALAASLAGIGNLLAYDDLALLQVSPRLQGLAHLGEILTSPYWPPPWNQEHYRPLTSVLLAVQWSIGSGDPVVFRVVSYLLYAAVAVAVFRLAGRIMPRPFALAAGLLFAAHPVHVEVVAPAVGQSELLVALLALLMTTRYLDARQAGTPTGRDWGFMAACYLLASLAKEHGFVLPALLLAVELFLLRGPLGARLGQLWRGYALLALVAVGLVALRLALLSGSFSGQWTAEVLEGLSPTRRLLTMLTVVPDYLRLLVWPAHLQLDYGPQEVVASTGVGLAEAHGAALLVAGALALLLAWRRAPAVAFGLAWTALMLLPFSNVLIPTGNVLAERFLFLPSAGFLLAAAGAVALVHRASAQRALEVILAVLMVAGVARSAERHRVWRSEAFLSVRGVQDAPLSFRAQRAYGDVLFDLGRRDLAEPAYQRALELAPPTHRWRVHNDLARRYRALGDTEAEVAALRASVAAHPAQEDTRGFLVAGLLLLGRYGEASREAEAALALAPSSEVFRGMRALADSAAMAGAPPGSVRIGIRTAAVRP